MVVLISGSNHLLIYGSFLPSLALKWLIDEGVMENGLAKV